MSIRYHSTNKCCRSCLWVKWQTRQLLGVFGPSLNPPPPPCFLKSDPKIRDACSSTHLTELRSIGSTPKWRGRRRGTSSWKRLLVLLTPVTHMSNSDIRVGHTQKNKQKKREKGKKWEEKPSCLLSCFGASGSVSVRIQDRNRGELLRTVLCLFIGSHTSA